MSPYLLDGLRVVELTTGIAGAYATKLLADAGADVVKVEPPGGDPLRRWSASHQDLAGRDGALFQYLSGSKRVVDPGGVREVLAGADVVLEGGTLTEADIARACDARTTVVTISPFGRGHEHADVPATEFTLQAWCGSIAGRGPADRPPLYAAGRLGEWFAGAYAAAAALALVHGGAGGHADLSMLECMTPPLGGFGALMARFMGVDEEATRGRPVRSLETPSIAPTSDGLVGFCTVTGQQFQDFLTLIERPDLIGDERYASFPARMARQAEFESIVSAWTSARTTAEVVDLAVSFRIPVAPLATPASLTSVDHFVERDVYLLNEAGGFLQPRAPYCVHGVPVRPVEPLVDHPVAVPPWRGARVSRTSTAPPESPLEGLRVVDLTAFWAGPATTQFLASLGADVVKLEGPKRPDGMRFTSARPPTDPDWLEWSAIFHSVNTNKRDVTLDLGDEADRRRLLDLVADADVVVENFSPRVLDGFGITYDVVHEVNPRAVMVRMPGFGLDGPWRDRAGFAQTMEQASGLAWITGHRDGLPVIPRGICDPLAGIHAAFALLAALQERKRSGVGRLVEVSMIDAALACAAEIVIEWSAYGHGLMRDGNRGPVSAPQGVYCCAEPEEWVALAVRDDRDWANLVDAVGRPAWAVDARYGDDAGRRAHHDDLDDRLAATFSTWPLDEAVDVLLRAGVPAAPVVPALRALHHPAMRARGFVESVEHPVVGAYEVMGLPFRLRGRGGGCVRRPAPTLGQDDEDVRRQPW